MLQLGPIQVMPNIAEEADLGQVWIHCSIIKINCNDGNEKFLGYDLVPLKPKTLKNPA